MHKRAKIIWNSKKSMYRACGNQIFAVPDNLAGWLLTVFVLLWCTDLLKLLRRKDWNRRRYYLLKFNNFFSDTIMNHFFKLLYWKDHSNSRHDSEPAQHLQNNLNHSCNWIIVANALSNKRSWKNLKSINMALKRPKLNDEVQRNELAPSRNSITYSSWLLNFLFQFYRFVSNFEWMFA